MQTAIYDPASGRHIRPIWLIRWTDAHGRHREMQLVRHEAPNARVAEARLRTAYRHEVGAVLDVTETAA